MQKIKPQIFILLIFSPIANAYIGPGMGGGVTAVILGILGAIFIAIFGFIYFPLKRWYKKRKKKVD